MSMFVCLSVTVLAYLGNHMAKLYQVFIMQRYASTVCVVVMCLCVCVHIESKWLNVRSCKQHHTILQGL